MEKEYTLLIGGEKKLTQRDLDKMKSLAEKTNAKILEGILTNESDLLTIGKKDKKTNVKLKMQFGDRGYSQFENEIYDSGYYTVNLIDSQELKKYLEKNQDIK